MLRIFLLTVWFVLAAVPAAHADPVSIGAAFGAIATWLASGTALANLALSAIFTAAKIGISLLQKANQTKQVAGVQADTKFGGDNPLSFIMGTFATPGQLEYANTYGTAGDTPNAFLTHVLSLGDLPMALTGLWVDDEKITLPDMSGGADADQGWEVSDITSASGQVKLWLRYLDGSQTAASSFLTSTFGSDADRPWESDMIGRGVPLLIPTAKFARTVFNGIPQYLAETSGIPLYDPREDTSVGGSGSQRWTTPSTWAPSDNPAVQVYNVLRGIYYDGEHIWGGRCEAWQLPVANWMAAMNACDSEITNADGSKEKQFRSGLEITTDQEPADVIEDILKGCNGRIAEMGGVYKVMVGTPGAAVYSFTDETIVVTEGQSLDPFPGQEQTVNGAQASYPEPEEKWAAKDAPAYLRADLEALDDDRRLVSGLQYPTVPYALQVQRLLQTAVQDARRFRVHQIVLPPEAWLLEPNDVVSWTSTWNGYEEKKFIVTEIEGDSNFLQYVTLKEVDPADYSWDADTDEKSYSVGFIGSIIPPAQAMTGWQVAPATFSANGKEMPSIQVSFSGDQDDVRAVHVQVRLALDDSIVFDGEAPYGDPATNANPKAVVLNGLFLPDTAYEARGSFVPYSDRETDWSAWLDVTTPNVWISDIYPIDLDRLEEDIKGYLDWIGTGLREQVRRMEELDLWIADQDFGNEYDRQQIRTHISAEMGDVRATYDQKIDVLVAEDAALAQIVTSLETEFDNTTATFTQEITTLSTDLDAVTARTTTLESNVSDVEGDVSVITSDLTSLEATVGNKADTSVVNSLSAEVHDSETGLVALGNSIQAVDSTVDNFSASGLFRVETVATESGAQSTIGLSASASAGGATNQAALFLSAVAGGKSRVSIVADQFVVTDGTNTQSPFLFTGGVAYLNGIKVKGAQIEDLVVDGTADISELIVGTSNIETGAVSRVVHNEAASVSFGEGNTLISVTLPSAKAGSTRLVKVMCSLVSSNSNNPLFNFQIRRGATTLSMSEFHGAISGLNAYTNVSQFATDASSTPGGNVTYSLRCNNAPSETVTASNVYIEVLELKN